MAEPIESHCRVGIVMPAAFPELASGNGSWPECLERVLEDAFFGAVEVSAIAEERVRREARAALEGAGVEVVFTAEPAIRSGRLDLNAVDLAERQHAVEICRQQIDQAYELGARIMTVMSGPDPGEAHRAAARERLIDSLKQLCLYAGERAQEYLLAISLENGGPANEPRRLVGPTKDAAQVIEAVRAEYSQCGLTLDLGWQPHLGESIADMVIGGADELIHARFGNCVLRGESNPGPAEPHPPFGTLGSAIGIEELRLYLETLIYGGFFARSVPTAMPVLSMVVQPRAGEPSGRVIANGKRALTYAWARLSHDRWAEGRI